MTSDFHKFFGKLILLFGEVPTETIVHKVWMEVGDDERQLRSLMGYLAAVAKCSLDERVSRAVLDVIAALGKERCR
jgi:hypothetical protein